MRNLNSIPTAPKRSDSIMFLNDYPPPSMDISLSFLNFNNYENSKTATATTEEIRISSTISVTESLMLWDELLKIDIPEERLLHKPVNKKIDTTETKPNVIKLSLKEEKIDLGFTLKEFLSEDDLEDFESMFLSLDSNRLKSYLSTKPLPKLPTAKKDNAINNFFPPEKIIPVISHKKKEIFEPILDLLEEEEVKKKSVDELKKKSDLKIKKFFGEEFINRNSKRDFKQMNLHSHQLKQRTSLPNFAKFSSFHPNDKIGLKGPHQRNARVPFDDLLFSPMPEPLKFSLTPNDLNY
ncbi:hypothetical protein HDU92_000709 [Lobulomyces angularis]|nr:hypothetical protein HDU92_000709 [Lobulomyces angularis]